MIHDIGGIEHGMVDNVLNLSWLGMIFVSTQFGMVTLGLLKNDVYGIRFATLILFISMNMIILSTEHGPSFTLWLFNIAMENHHF
jgi:hypothetical protein